MKRELLLQVFTTTTHGVGLVLQLRHERWSFLPSHQYDKTSMSPKILEHAPPRS
jgi:hypothetical protein